MPHSESSTLQGAPRRERLERSDASASRSTRSTNSWGLRSDTLHKSRQASPKVADWRVAQLCRRSPAHQRNRMRLPGRTLRHVALAAVLTACSDPQSPGHAAPSLDAAEQQISSSGNAFSFALFQQLAKREAGKNVFAWPLTAPTHLGMAMNGAAGPTFDAMRTALRLGNGDMGQIDTGYRGLVDVLRGLDPTTTFQIANSIWYRNSVSFRQ